MYFTLNESAVKKELTEDLIQEETDPLAIAADDASTQDDLKHGCDIKTEPDTPLEPNAKDDVLDVGAIKDEIEIDYDYLND